MRVGIFGGTFDPPHIAHYLAIHYAKMMAQLDQVLVIPCWDHAFEKGRRMSPFEHRYEMAQRAFEERGIVVSGIERDIKSRYTIQMVKALRDTRLPSDEIYLIVGADNADHMDRWHQWDQLKHLVNVFPVGREGECDPEKYPVRMPKLSSTQIREMVSQGGDFGKLVPPKVVSYIRQNGLYR